MPTSLPTSLRELADRHGLLVGAAYNPRAMDDDPLYGRVLAREFNCLVAENHMKFKYLQPRRGEFDFAAADRMLDFSDRHGMAVRGHTLVWHNSIPDWLRQANVSRREALDILRDHIFTVLDHFRGRVFAWDVVNEALGDTGDGFYRDTSWWHQTVGPEYIDHAFRWAHEADPEIQLFYNDYDVEWVELKCDRTRRLVESMQERGVPIHGVGFQYHTRAADAPSPEDVARRVGRFNELGLAVHFTELDIKIPSSPSANDLRQQAAAGRTAIEVALAADNCPAVVFWGFTDKYSWIPNFTKGAYDHALVFDREYRPKPVLNAMMEALQKR